MLRLVRTPLKAPGLRQFSSSKPQLARRRRGGGGTASEGAAMHLVPTPDGPGAAGDAAQPMQHQPQPEAPRRAGGTSSFGMAGGSFVYAEASSLSSVRDDIAAMRAAEREKSSAAAAAASNMMGGQPGAGGDAPQRAPYAAKPKGFSARATPHGSAPWAGDGDGGAMGEGAVAGSGAAPPAYDLTELQRLQQQRLSLTRQLHAADAKDVLRSRTSEYLARLPQLDEFEQAKQQGRMEALHLEMKGQRSLEGKVAHVAALTDEELLGYLKSGALDPMNMWEGSSELSALPGEFFPARRAVELTTSIAKTIQPSNPSDDDAVFLAKVGRGDPEQFSANEIESLEAYELRNRFGYLSQPNSVLNYVAQQDAGFKRSLAVMDRTRRRVIKDAEFQSALAFSHEQNEEEFERLQQSGAMKASPQAQAKAVDASLFFDKKFSKPPKRAESGVPKALPKAAPERAQHRARQRKVRDLRYARGGKADLSHNKRR